MALAEWADHLAKVDKMLLSYHSGRVHSMSLSARTSTMVTAGDDESVRLWDFNKTDRPCQVADDFSERRTELPHSICMHPLGSMVAFG